MFNISCITWQNEEIKIIATLKIENLPKAEMEKQMFFKTDNSPKERIGERSKLPTCVNLNFLKYTRYGSQSSRKNCPMPFIKRAGDHDKIILITHIQMYIFIAVPKI